MLDEMYLQTSQWKYYWPRCKWGFLNWYTGLHDCCVKKSISYVIKACPGVSINGEMVKQEIEESLQTLKAVGFNVRAIIIDNHSTIVSGYSKLSEKYGIDDDFFIYYEGSNIYLMYT